MDLSSKKFCTIIRASQFDPCHSLVLFVAVLKPKPVRNKLLPNLSEKMHLL